MQTEKVIYMQQWLDIHARNKIVPSDGWYVDLANRVWRRILGSRFYESVNEGELKQVAIIIALYLEDCVANEGHWRKFIRWHHEQYGKYLPFYALTDAYAPDEINVEDICFLLWAIHSPCENEYIGVENPWNEEMVALAHDVYQCLDERFEEAPISTHLAPDWLIEDELMETPLTPLPTIAPNEELASNVANFMKASGGESLMYFESYQALKLFFTQWLKWEDDDETLLPELKEFDNFVLYANPKGLLIGPDVAPYFADKRNPMYSPEKAEEEAYELFCDQGLCPFDLLKYAMKHQLLPDAQFPFDKGKEFLHANWDFIARWFLGESYEGK